MKIENKQLKNIILSQIYRPPYGWNILFEKQLKHMLSKNDFIFDYEEKKRFVIL